MEKDGNEKQRREGLVGKIVKMTLLWRKITFLIDVAIAIIALAKGDEADRVEIFYVVICWNSTHNP